jgi:hypothetical protein
MNRLLRVVLSVLSGLVATAMASALIVVLAYGSIVWGFTHSHPNDPSAGDSVAWAFLFLSPGLLGVGLPISAVVGFLTYLALSKRMTGD